MNKEFIPYEQALALKELGFDEPCFGYYYTLNGKDWKFAEKSEYYRLDEEINIGPKFSLLAPTFSQAFRWFREKYQLFGGILSEYSYGGQIHAYHITGRHQGDISKGHFNTYEEAELAYLKKLIEIVKQK
jgi:hypothetical protein